MRAALLSLLMTLPLLGQLPAGVTRTNFRDFMYAYHLAATPDGVVWVVDLLNYEVARVNPDGTAQSIDMPRPWNSRAVTAGPDGALWISGVQALVRVDPVTNEMQRFPVGAAVHLLSGADGNLWMITAGSVTRVRPDGVVLSTYATGGGTAGAAFGSDGALYVAATTRLVRITLAGERTEFPANARHSLFAGPNFLWSGPRGFNEPGERKAASTITKLSLTGETLATYTLDMMAFASDALGNLWLRTTLEDGSDIVGKLSPYGVLTRLGPLPPLPWTECFPRYYGGMTVLSDGRIAMADYYPDIPRPAIAPAVPCFGARKPAELRNTVTVLDPRLLPVISIDALDGKRRRSTRH